MFVQPMSVQVTKILYIIVLIPLFLNINLVMKSAPENWNYHTRRAKEVEESRMMTIKLMMGVSFAVLFIICSLKLGLPMKKVLFSRRKLNNNQNALTISSTLDGRKHRSVAPETLNVQQTEVELSLDAESLERICLLKKNVYRVLCRLRIGNRHPEETSVTKMNSDCLNNIV